MKLLKINSEVFGLFELPLLIKKLSKFSLCQRYEIYKLRFLIFIFFINLLFLDNIELTLAIPQMSVEEIKGPVSFKAEYLSYEEETQTIYALNSARVVYQDIKLTADSVAFVIPTKTVYAYGNVNLRFRPAPNKPLQKLECAELEYQLDTYRGKAVNPQTELPPWFIHAEKIDQLSKFEQRLTDSSFTTCDLEKPHYHLFAKEMTVYPEKLLVARYVYFYIRNTPIFYLPYYRRSLKEKEARFSLEYGHSSYAGYFVKGYYKIPLDEESLAGLHLDYYSEKGIGYGLDLEYRIPSVTTIESSTTEVSHYPYHIGKLLTFYIDERDTDLERYRMYLRHLSDFGSGLTARLYADYPSDASVDKDYIQPESTERGEKREAYISLQKLEDNYIFRLDSRRIDELIDNEYRLSQQEIAQLGFYSKYQDLGSLPIKYRVSTLIKEARYPGENFLSSEDDYSALVSEFSTSVIYSFPLTDRLTWINELEEKSLYISDTAKNLSVDEFASIATLRSKLHAELNQQLQTELIYDYSWYLTDDKFADFLCESNTISAVFTYRWLPKTRIKLLSMYNLKSETELNEDEDIYHTRLGLAWYPNPKIKFDIHGTMAEQIATYPYHEQGQGIYSSIKYTPNDKWWTSLSSYYQHWVSDELDISSTSNRLNLSFGTRLGEKWKLSLSAIYELQDGEDDELIEKQVTLYRDLHCWEAYLRFRDREGDKSIRFVLNLKAFPTKRITLEGKTSLF